MSHLVDRNMSNNIIAIISFGFLVFLLDITIYINEMALFFFFFIFQKTK
jgi:hypothetical protein